MRIADVVEQAGLAVVDVAHDHNDRRAVDEILFLILMIVDQAFFDRDDHLTLDLATELHRHESGGIIINEI